MDFTVRIHNGIEVVEKRVKKGSGLLDVLRRSQVEINAPCGGNRTCGKCRIKVEGISTPAEDMELKLLGDKAVSEGYRLACYIEINDDIDVYTENEEEKAVIMAERNKKDLLLDPIIQKKHVCLLAPEINDQDSDMNRVLNQLPGENTMSLSMIKDLPAILREKDFSVTLIMMNDKFIGIESGDTSDSLYGIAVDIGTTTIASYLIDLNTGEEKGVHSNMNPQRKYGADVIARISYTMNNVNGTAELSDVIISNLNKGIEYLAAEAGIEPEDIYTVVLAGNTTMTHLLMGIPPRNIAMAPFIPVTTDIHKLLPSEIGLKINPGGIAVILPAVSAYIGADIVAAVLSSGMHEDDGISLLIDIGTNGEVVLGNKKWMFSCSVAAGPAFEGAQIRNGVGGIVGAIDTMDFKDGFRFTTIGNEKAVGICGSGIVDAIAGLLDTGIVDEMGRIVDLDELTEKTTSVYADRIEDTDEGRIFKVMESDDTRINSDIVITQKDIRELQNAKAAVAAGIITLINKAGIKIDDIDNIYLAGGFGSYLNIDSTLRIGLIPKELDGKIKVIGNAAGSGAVEVMMNKESLRAVERIHRNIKYIELSSDKEFVNEYVEAMEFKNNRVNIH